MICDCRKEQQRRAVLINLEEEKKKLEEKINQVKNQIMNKRKWKTPPLPPIKNAVLKENAQFLKREIKTEEQTFLRVNNLKLTYSFLPFTTSGFTSPEKFQMSDNFFFVLNNNINALG